MVTRLQYVKDFGKSMALQKGPNVLHSKLFNSNEDGHMEELEFYKKGDHVPAPSLEPDLCNTCYPPIPDVESAEIEETGCNCWECKHEDLNEFGAGCNDYDNPDCQFCNHTEEEDEVAPTTVNLPEGDLPDNLQSIYDAGLLAKSFWNPPSQQAQPTTSDWTTTWNWIVDEGNSS